ncbi:phosphopantetheine-binding protein [Caulobacter sp. FWC2]|jgi:acyl carrier protein|uniref:phosphopantetheine-binding protein n=1 Tax=Caulobacter sp. FWC2 TaxID=69664 RepID=UPI000C1621C3|nr:phosphopantetheine-binding protein [Caulobacter sp. FWC2]PIB94189.1 acyl carrier protein [Caulobacter sp. FWC2]
MQTLYAGLAEIFEIDTAEVTADTVLANHNWDSLAIVSTIALVDEICGELLDGAALAECVTVSDIAALIPQAKAA